MNNVLSCAVKVRVLGNQSVVHLCFILYFSLFMASCSNSGEEAAQFFLKGNVQLQKREYTEAIRYYSEAIAKKPDFADAYNNRGLAKFRNDDREGALADYTRAIDADPDFGTAYFNRAEVRLETGDAGGSVADLERIEQQYGDSTFYQTRLADAYVQLNKPAQAQVAYDRALQLDPNNVDALTNRGAFYFSQKAYDAAGLDVRRALQLNPKQDAALNNQSLLLARAGKYTEALTSVEQALTLKPRQPYYLNNKAYLLLKAGRPAEALPLVEESLQRDPQNAWAHRTLGLYWLGEKQPQKGTPRIPTGRNPGCLRGSALLLHRTGRTGRRKQSPGLRGLATGRIGRG